MSHLNLLFDFFNQLSKLAEDFVINLQSCCLIFFRVAFALDLVLAISNQYQQVTRYITFTRYISIFHLYIPLKMAEKIFFLYKILFFLYKIFLYKMVTQ